MVARYTLPVHARSAGALRMGASGMGRSGCFMGVADSLRDGLLSRVRCRGCGSRARHPALLVLSLCRRDRCASLNPRYGKGLVFGQAPPSPPCSDIGNTARDTGDRGAARQFGLTTLRPVLRGLSSLPMADLPIPSGSYTALCVPCRIEAAAGVVPARGTQSDRLICFQRVDELLGRKRLFTFHALAVGVAGIDLGKRDPRLRRGGVECGHRMIGAGLVLFSGAAPIHALGHDFAPINSQGLVGRMEMCELRITGCSSSWSVSNRGARSCGLSPLARKPTHSAGRCQARRPV